MSLPRKIEGMILLNESWREREKRVRRAEIKRAVLAVLYALAWLGAGLILGWFLTRH